MRHTIVDYVDNLRALATAAAPSLLPTKPAPDPSEEQDPSKKDDVVKNTAKHISDHVEDPMGSTKEMFEDLGQKQADYEQSKAKARVALAPVKAVLQHVDQVHQLTPQMENPDQAMGYHDPNDPNSNQPQPMPGQMTKPGTLPNMATTPQQMNQGRPSKVGVGKPGVAPGPQQSVRPAKMGVPTPGGGGGNPARPSAKPAAGGKNGGRSIKIHVQGAAEVGDQEIRNKLQEALREKFDGSSGGDVQVPCSGCGIGKYPYIEDVFSAGKYIVYNLDGKKYKLTYTVSSKGEVTLAEKPTEVRIAYVAAKADKLSTIMAGIDVGTERIYK